MTLLPNTQTIPLTVLVRQAKPTPKTERPARKDDAALRQAVLLKHLTR